VPLKWALIPIVDSTDPNGPLFGSTANKIKIKRTFKYYVDNYHVYYHDISTYKVRFNMYFYMLYIIRITVPSESS
jgi:hypothetical protein